MEGRWGGEACSALKSEVTLNVLNSLALPKKKRMWGKKDKLVAFSKEAKYVRQSNVLNLPSGNICQTSL